MNNDEARIGVDPAGTARMNREAAPAGLSAWPAWLAAACFALLAAFLLAAHLALRTETVLLREQAALAGIEVKTLRQQIEAERILAARRMAELAGGHMEPRDLGRLQVVPLVPPADAASRSLAVIVFNPDCQEGELVVAALPAVAPDKSYQLWLFDHERPAGANLAAFTVDSEPDQVRVPFKLDRSILKVPDFKVFLGRRGDASAPEGPVVLASH